MTSNRQPGGWICCAGKGYIEFAEQLFRISGIVVRLQISFLMGIDMVSKKEIKWFGVKFLSRMHYRSADINPSIAIPIIKHIDVFFIDEYLLDLWS
jgi:hypothetical protein